MIDNSRLQVFANHCAAAAEGMGYTLMRTSYSTFVKETEDFSCQLLTPDGQTFASPKSFGATWFTGLDYGPVLSEYDYEEGDIYLTNDPYSGFVSTHSPDIHLWKPVFRDGRTMCFVGCHVHNTDVGGAVPASLSRTLTEIYQEGLRIPPMRLMHRGELNRDLMRIIATNVRAPDQNQGDLNAQIACVNTGERKVHDIIDRFGSEEFSSGMGRLLDYAEAQARAVIRTIPDGEYRFADYADEDSVAGYPCRLAMTLRVRGDEVVLDYTGSDPQALSSLNIPTGGNERHALAMVGLTYVLYTLDPTILLNTGTVRPARAILPPGTVMNAIAPAAVGMRSLLCGVAQVLTFGAFSQALPDRLPACPSSMSSLVNVKTTTAGGRTVMASIGPVGGGAGGGPFADGTEGSGGSQGFLKNTPVEINEVEVPIRIRRYGLVPDSGGAGRWRGGQAAIMEFQIFAPQSMVTARNRNHSEITPWGVLGGKAGATSRFVINPETNHAVELRNTDIVVCKPNDIVRIQGAGAGGYGHPFDRPEEAVAEDVRRGFVSPARAQADYGVVVENGILDAAASEALRGRARGADRNGEHFDFSPGRRSFETVWTLERYAALNAILAAIPVTWRHFVKHHVFAAIGERAAPAGGGGEDVHRIYRELTAQFADLPSPDAIARAA